MERSIINPIWYKEHNRWFDVQLVHDGKKPKLYIDGVLRKRLPRKLKKRLKKSILIDP